MSVQVLVIHAPGTNRDGDMAEACTLAGGQPDIVPLSVLVSTPKKILEYDFLVLPGGFSYGDDLGAGKAWSSILRQAFYQELETFVQSGRPILGMQWISNASQIRINSECVGGGASMVQRTTCDAY